MQQVFFQKVVFGPPPRGEAMYDSVPELDLEIRRSGDGHPDPYIRGSPVSKKFLSVWSKNKQGVVGGWPL